MKLINKCFLVLSLSVVGISSVMADEKSYDVKCWNPSGNNVFDENVSSITYSTQGGPWFEVTLHDGKKTRLFNLSCRITEK